MLYLVGIGLFDEKDITVKGLEIVKKVDRVYLEMYTSIIGRSKTDLEKFYGRELILADRELVEQNSEDILNLAKEHNVAVLVAGDPFGATTHTDLLLRAREQNVSVQVVHNASIMNAVGCCGLQLYNFGETVSIPFWTESWKPDSFLDKIIRNYSCGLHTLCLLDIQVKEPTLESMTKKRKEYHPPRFMKITQAASQIISALERRASCVLSVYTACVGLARVGSDTQKIVKCSLETMTTVDLGEPLHSLVIVGTLHPLEEQFLQQFHI